MIKTITRNETITSDPMTWKEISRDRTKGRYFFIVVSENELFNPFNNSFMAKSYRSVDNLVIYYGSGMIVLCDCVIKRQNNGTVRVWNRNH